MREEWAVGNWVSDRWAPFLIAHLDGVPWYEASIPRRLHHCKPQTRVLSGGIDIGRCACGATWYGGSPWLERNSRRKK